MMQWDRVQLECDTFGHAIAIESWEEQSFIAGQNWTGMTEVHVKVYQL